MVLQSFILHAYVPYMRFCAARRSALRRRVNSSRFSYRRFRHNVWYAAISFLLCTVRILPCERVCAKLIALSSVIFSLMCLFPFISLLEICIPTCWSAVHVRCHQGRDKDPEGSAYYYADHPNKQIHTSSPFSYPRYVCSFFCESRHVFVPLKNAHDVGHG